MERVIRILVKKELFEGQACPPITCRRFHPESRDIRNHMFRATNKLKESRIDQENLFIKIKKWKDESPENFIYFRAYGKNNSETTFEQLFFNENGDRIHVIKLILYIFY